MLCNNGWGTCSCAVTIGAGAEVYTVNHCDGYHMETFLIRETGKILVEENKNLYGKRVKKAQILNLSGVLRKVWTSASPRRLSLV